MARTRSEIQDLVVLNTGRTDKDTLMDSLCDSALRIAVMKHPFKESLSLPSDFAITEDATSVDISSICPIVHIVTARIVEAVGSKNKSLVMMNRTWWDKNVVNAEDNQKGWPDYGLRWSTNVVLERPANSNLELRLRVSTVPTFTDDSTECPIEILDLFVEKYVTAYVFLSIQNTDMFLAWKMDALGPRFESGVVGGELLNAINADKYDIAEEPRAQAPITTARHGSVSIENLITGHDRYGFTDSWY